MTIELNKVKTDYLERNQLRSESALQKNFPIYQSNKLDVKISNRILMSSEKLGYIYYQQEDNNKSIEHLKLAAEATSYEFLYQPPPQIIEHTRTPWEYIFAMELVVSFGNESDLNRLLQVDETKIIYGEPEHIAKCKLLSSTAFSLRKYLKDEMLDKETISDLYGLSTEANVNKEQKHFIVPIVNGLKALVEDSKAAWEASIQAALNAHLKEVKSGDYRNDIDGFICMPGMMLIKFGSKKGWQTDIDSLYLPKQLMELS